MPINHVSFSVNVPSASEAQEIADVGEMAAGLLVELQRVSEEIERIHRWRAKSDQIQETFFPWLQRQHMVSVEKTEGFEDTATRRNRPDAQIWLNQEGNRRILVEVERGGAVTNNHDLKDMWKAHLSPIVQHLFLIVPNTIEDESGALRSDQAFIRCSARLSSFFTDPRTELDVLSLHLFGYGSDPVSRMARVQRH